MPKQRPLELVVEDDSRYSQLSDLFGIMCVTASNMDTLDDALKFLTFSIDYVVKEVNKRFHSVEEPVVIELYKGGSHIAILQLVGFMKMERIAMIKENS